MPALGLPTGDVISRLSASGCVAAGEEAEQLLAAAPDDETLEAWVRRRERGEPLAWITGTVRFCGHSVHVDRGVYVPRRQTEELARRGAAVLATSAGRAADLCTGSGAVALHLRAAVPAAAVVGVEIDGLSAACARRNGVNVVVADVDAPLRPAAFDVVTAVPPYVPTAGIRLLPADVQRYEPRLALDGGDDGLDVARRLVLAAGRLLRPGGWLLIELGGDQDRALRPALRAAGFASGNPWFDEEGDLRGVIAQYEGR
jgi:release factor glutamine methyltransferase